ncbi:hypothetical protein [uncultured Draconibacterium sp.]|uniref:hypothetical protein n=1 Tax=uncultured Draconibacterium sp. TaxID=1573823 RepID=UPI0025D8CC18|nr:hypothetical protein [uncultured Draconibacterium sp.]
MLIEKKHIWYASYGSNLLEERFLCYILGGQPKGAKSITPGCSDKSLPLKNKKILINSELYFAKESKTWSKGGVAFIKTQFDKLQKTYGRMYLISEEQFVEVVKQEINLKEKLVIDFKSIAERGSMIVKENSWYGNVIFLGMDGEFPIFTFTFQDNIQKFNKPSPEYLKTIINGLKETYDFKNDEISDYLLSKNGISGNYSINELKNLMK